MGMFGTGSSSSGTGESRRIAQRSAMLTTHYPELDPDSVYQLASQPTGTQEMMQSVGGTVDFAKIQQASAEMKQQPAEVQSARWNGMSDERRKLYTDAGYVPPDVQARQNDADQSWFGSVMSTVGAPFAAAKDAAVSTVGTVADWMGNAADFVGGRPWRAQADKGASEQLARDTLMLREARKSLEDQGVALSDEQWLSMYRNYYNRNPHTYADVGNKETNPFTGDFWNRGFQTADGYNPHAAHQEAFGEDEYKQFEQKVYELQSTSEYDMSWGAAWGRTASGDEYVPPSVQIEAQNKLGRKDTDAFDIALKMAKGKTAEQIVKDEGYDPSDPRFAERFDEISANLANKDFNDAVDLMKRNESKVSIGRDFAGGTLELDPNSRAYTFASGGTDALVAITGDPTLLAGKASKSVKLARWAIDATDGASAIERVSEVAKLNRLGKAAEQGKALRLVEFTDDVGEEAIKAGRLGNSREVLRPYFEKAGLTDVRPVLDSNGRATRYLEDNYDAVKAALNEANEDINTKIAAAYDAGKDTVTIHGVDTPIDSLYAVQDEAGTVVDTLKGAVSTEHSSPKSLLKGRERRGLGSVDIHDQSRGLDQAAMAAGDSRAADWLRVRDARKQGQVADRIAQAFVDSRNGDELAFDALVREQPQSMGILSALREHEKIMVDELGHGIEDGDDVFKWWQSNAGVTALAEGRGWSSHLSSNLIELPRETFTHRTALAARNRIGKTVDWMRTAGTNSEARGMRWAEIEKSGIEDAVMDRTLAWQMGRPVRGAGKLLYNLGNKVPRERFLSISEDSENAIEEFRKFLHFGAFADMDRAVMGRYFDEFVKGGEAARLNTIKAFMTDFYSRTGAFDHPIMGDRARDMIERITTQAYAPGGIDEIQMGAGQVKKVAVLPYAQHSEMTEIPSFRELAANNARMTGLQKVLGKINSPMVDSFMSVGWKPALLLRAGFVPRTAGDEILTFMARHSPGAYIDSKLAGMAASDVSIADWFTRKLIPPKVARAAPKEAFQMRRALEFEGPRQWMAQAAEDFGFTPRWGDRVGFTADWVASRAVKHLKRAEFKLASEGAQAAALAQGYGRYAATEVKGAGRAAVKGFDVDRDVVGLVDIARERADNVEALEALLTHSPFAADAFAREMSSAHGRWLTDVTQGDDGVTTIRIAGNKADPRQRVVEIKMSPDGTWGNYVLGEGASESKTALAAGLHMLGGDPFAKQGMYELAGLIPEDKAKQIASLLQPSGKPRTFPGVRPEGELALGRPGDTAFLERAPGDPTGVSGHLPLGKAGDTGAFGDLAGGEATGVSGNLPFPREGGTTASPLPPRPPVADVSDPARLSAYQKGDIEHFRGQAREMLTEEATYWENEVERILAGRSIYLPPYRKGKWYREDIEGVLDSDGPGLPTVRSMKYKHGGATGKPIFTTKKAKGAIPDATLEDLLPEERAELVDALNQLVNARATLERGGVQKGFDLQGELRDKLAQRVGLDHPFAYPDEAFAPGPVADVYAGASEQNRVYSHLTRMDEEDLYDLADRYGIDPNLDYEQTIDALAQKAGAPPRELDDAMLTAEETSPLDGAVDAAVAAGEPAAAAPGSAPWTEGQQVAAAAMTEEGRAARKAAREAARTGTSAQDGIDRLTALRERLGALSEDQRALLVESVERNPNLPSSVYPTSDDTWSAIKAAREAKISLPPLLDRHLRGALEGGSLDKLVASVLGERAAIGPAAVRSKLRDIESVFALDRRYGAMVLSDSPIRLGEAGEQIGNMRRRLFKSLNDPEVLGEEMHSYALRNRRATIDSNTGQTVAAPLEPGTRSFYSIMGDQASIDRFAATLQEQGPERILASLTEVGMKEHDLKAVGKFLEEWDTEFQDALHLNRTLTHQGDMRAMTRFGFSDFDQADRIRHYFRQAGLGAPEGADAAWSLGAARAHGFTGLTDDQARLIAETVEDQDHLFRMAPDMQHRMVPMEDGDGVRQVRYNDAGELDPAGQHVVDGPSAEDAQRAHAEKIEAMISQMLDHNGEVRHELLEPLLQGRFTADHVYNTAVNDLPAEFVAPNFHLPTQNWYEKAVAHGFGEMLGPWFDALVRAPLFQFNFTRGMKASRVLESTLKNDEVFRVGLEAAEKAGTDLSEIRRLYRNMPAWQRETIDDVQQMREAINEAHHQVNAAAIADDANPDALDFHGLEMLDDADLEKVRVLMAHDADVQSKLVQVASNRAVNDSIPYIDDHNVRSMFQEHARNIMPFEFAQEQFLARWARTFVHSPEAFRRAQLLAHGFTSSGFVHKNERGEDVFVIPFSESATKLIAKAPVISALWGGPAEIPMSVPLTGEVRSMLAGGEKDVTQLPSLSPIAQLPIGMLANHFPEIRSVGKAFGTPVNTDESVIGSLMPTWARNVFKGIAAGPDAEKELQGSVVGALQMMEAEAIRLRSEGDELSAAGKKDEAQEKYDRAAELSVPDGATEDEMQAHIDEVKRWARGMMVARGVMGFASPANPHAELYANQEDMKLAPEFHELMTHMPFDEAYATYMAEHPEAAPYAVFRSTKDSKAPVPATEQAMDWVNANKGFLERYDVAAPWLIPAQKTADEFSMEAYHDEMAIGLRRLKSPDEWYRDFKFASAGEQYFENKEKIDAAVARLEANGNDDGVRQLKDRWSAWSGAYRAQNPVFDRLLQEDRSSTREDAIRQLRVALDDPEVPKVEHAEALRLGLDALDQYQSELASLKGDNRKDAKRKREVAKAWFMNYGKWLESSYPESRMFWRNLVLPTAGLRATDTDVPATSRAA